MSKTGAMMKASLLQLRIYLLCVTGFIAAGLLANVIVYLADASDDMTGVSIANQFLIFLLFVASVLPAAYFKRIINLGASRKQYYFGLLAIYLIWAAAFSVINVLWIKLETGLFRGHLEAFNILEIFHWDQFGVAGMLVYQFGTYLLLMSLLNLLFSGLRHWAGWLIWAVLVAAIPVGTSVPSLRPYVVDGLKALLFNDSLLRGFGLTMILSFVFLAGGWFFTRKRPF